MINLKIQGLMMYLNKFVPHAAIYAQFVVVLQLTVLHVQEIESILQHVAVLLVILKKR
jgi:hypothetical protein